MCESYINELCVTSISPTVGGFLSFPQKMGENLQWIDSKCVTIDGNDNDDEDDY